MSNNTPQHSNVLIPSQPDHYCLVRAVEEKFNEVCLMYQKLVGVDLMVPKHLNPDVIRCNEMRARHKRGDLRHTEAEHRSVKAVAEWLLEVNASIRNQQKPKIVWG